MSKTIPSLSLQSFGPHQWQPLRNFKSILLLRLCNWSNGSSGNLSIGLWPDYTCPTSSAPPKPTASKEPYIFLYNSLSIVIVILLPKKFYLNLWDRGGKWICDFMSMGNGTSVRGCGCRILTLGSSFGSCLRYVLWSLCKSTEFAGFGRSTNLLTLKFQKVIFEVCLFCVHCFWDTTSIHSYKETPAFYQRKSCENRTKRVEKFSKVSLCSDDHWTIFTKFALLLATKIYYGSPLI